MLRKLRMTNQKGFTLIELMIVIAIIGILAAIAIPNFISYRNRAYCSAAEADARSVAAAVADYFADPDHTGIPATTDLSGISIQNSFTIGGTNPNNSIVIIVTDGSGRCRRGTAFQLTMPEDTSDGW